MTTANTNASPSTTSTPRSTHSSGLSKRWPKLSSRQRSGYGPSRDTSNPSKSDSGGWNSSFQNSWRRAQEALRTRRLQNVISKQLSRSQKIQNPMTKRLTPITKKLGGRREPPTLRGKRVIEGTTGCQN